jgi:predicted esterase
MPRAFLLVAILSSFTSVALADTSAGAVGLLETYLSLPRADRPELAAQDFADVPLSQVDAERAEALLWEDHVTHIRASRQPEMAARSIRLGSKELRFDYRIFGEKPTSGRSLFISMHGGGGTTKVVNDQQWENQKRLYRPKEGVYLAPRAPTDTWNLWHQGHIDDLFDRLIENLVVFEDVNPNRVYLMGYSAGGDGVYQLGPRMADRWAAAAMMAGHPNEASPLGLRNIGFAIHVGENDDGYNRNDVARKWARELAALQDADPDGYKHHVQLHADKGHWMDRQDAVAVPWMSRFTRNPTPNRVVWKQDDVTHNRFYWLAVPPQQAERGAEIIACYEGRTVTIQSTDVDDVTVYLKDTMVNLDEPVVTHFNGKKVFRASVNRTIATLHATLSGRGDRQMMYSAQVTL